MTETALCENVLPTICSGLRVADPMTRVSVVIPCQNEATFIETLLEAVRAQDYPAHEIIVVDSCSTDGSRAIVERYQAAHPEMPLRIVDCVAPGPAAAANAGVRAAEGDTIVRLDGHSLPPPNYIRRLVAMLEEPDAGVVGGVWDIQPGGRSDTAAAIVMALNHKLGTGAAAYRHGQPAPARKDVDTVPFGCYRRSHWDALGGYNERLLTNEDYEFNYRTRRAGRRVILDAGLRCTYFARATLRDLASQYFRWGWWKAQMLKSYPQSMRLRQAIPAAFVLALVLLAAAGLLVRPAWWLLAGLLAVYLAAIATAAVTSARTARRWRLAPAIVAAFAIIHLVWGSALLANLASFGSWPRWTRRVKAA